MIHRLRSVVQFVLTIKFGVVLLLCLMVVMMFATQFEASFGTRAMKHYIYGSLWFDAGVFLFVVNIVVNTLRRRPYKWRHTGFLTVHVGVLLCVAGGLMTRWFGVDGTMPIPEGSDTREISLPENDLRITAGGRTFSHETDYEVLPARSQHDDLFAVPGTDYLVNVTTYYPTGAVTDTLLDDADEPNPVIRVAVGGPGAEPAGGWLVARDPARSTLASGSARVTLVESEGLPALLARWQRSTDGAAEAAESAGHLRLFWADGTAEVVHVPAAPDGPLPTTREGVTVEVVQVFRSFTLTAEGHADAVGNPDNPAIRFKLHGPDGTEEHFSFTAFPEFRVEPPEGAPRILGRAEWQPEAAALGRGTDPLGIAVVHEGAGRFITRTSWGDPTDGTPLDVGETRSFESRGALLRILDAAENGRLARAVTKVSDEIMRPVIHVAVVEKAGRDTLRFASFVNLLRGRPEVRPADITPNDAWIFHGEGFDFPTPDGDIRVDYAGRTIPLDFAVHLEDFQEVQYPGISLAASYESHVIVEPANDEEFRARIYMNHPLIYAGYTFFQASFQRTPAGEEITVLSVAHDPGMTVSFVGYCVLTVGLVLIFFVKPYLRRLDERIARNHAAAKGAQT